MWLKALVVGLYVSLFSSVAVLVHADNAKVMVVGDSISAGYGVPSGEGWTDLLVNAVEQPIVMINASISGETTVGGAARMQTLLDQHRPDIVILELGGNDGLRGYPLQRIEKNLATMIEQSQQSGSCAIVLLGMRIPPNYGARYSEGFFNIYGSLAKRYETGLVPFFLDNVAEIPSLMQDDGIHPTQAAQPILVNNALNAVNQALKQCAG